MHYYFFPYLFGQQLIDRSSSIILGCRETHSIASRQPCAPKPSAILWMKCDFCRSYSHLVYCIAKRLPLFWWTIISKMVIGIFLEWWAQPPQSKSTFSLSREIERQILVFPLWMTSKSTCMSTSKSTSHMASMNSLETKGFGWPVNNQWILSAFGRVWLCDSV